MPGGQQPGGESRPAWHGCADVEAVERQGMIGVAPPPPDGAGEDLATLVGHPRPFGTVMPGGEAGEVVMGGDRAGRRPREDAVKLTLGGGAQQQHGASGKPWEARPAWSAE